MSTIMNGFLNIYKPKGISSFDVIRQLRRITGIKKIGHCGTLDPLATGVLVVAIGEATKLLEYLLKMDKSYRAEIVLGKSSVTFDAEGIDEGECENIGRDDLSVFDKTGFSGKLGRNDIENLIEKKFLGVIDQVPPKYSALKIGGKRACDLVREGKEVEMKSRKVNIYGVEIVEYKWPRLVLDVNCGSGTYIRSFANDLGEELGCGGYLSGLERTRVGDFLIENSHEINVRCEVLDNGKKNYVDITKKEEIEKWLLPMEVAVLSDGFGGKDKSVSESDMCGVVRLGRIDVSVEEYRRLSLGQFIDNEQGVDEEVAAFCEDRLVGVVETVSNKRQLKFKKKLNSLG